MYNASRRESLPRRPKDYAVGLSPLVDSGSHACLLGFPIKTLGKVPERLGEKKTATRQEKKK